MVCSTCQQLAPVQSLHFTCFAASVEEQVEYCIAETIFFSDVVQQVGCGLLIVSLCIIWFAVDTKALPSRGYFWNMSKSLVAWTSPTPFSNQIQIILHLEKKHEVILRENCLVIYEYFKCFSFYSHQVSARVQFHLAVHSNSRLCTNPRP